MGDNGSDYRSRKREREGIYMTLYDSKKKLALAGVVCGIVAAILAFMGNPANMAFCIACFVRDMAGSLGMHQAEVVQYARPEIVGLVLGSFVISVATREYRSTAGSSPMIRFVLGMIIMIGSLVFLGCPLRMVIRMSAGDLNAWVALVGFICGVATGTIMLKNGTSLGRSHETGKASGTVLPILLAGVLVLAAAGLLKASEAGPGSLHAPVIASLIGGLVFGAFAQKSRMCFAGGIRDVILMKNFDLLTVIGSLFVVMLIFNVATGRFVVGFNTPGIIAHADHLWNFLGMYAVGFAAVLAGGCPLRQLILAGQGSSDSAVTVLGLFFGAALCHNLGIASSGTALNAETNEVVAGAATQNGKIAVIICIIVCFVIAFTNKRESVKK
ncbi:MAG: YedE family putative selenium transporter [Eubacteriales bacterium]|nr:YedE family putative selenium transporter [Eubacteriales bacterium]